MLRYYNGIKLVSSLVIGHNHLFGVCEPYPILGGFNLVPRPACLFENTDSFPISFSREEGLETRLGWIYIIFYDITSEYL